MNNDWHFHNPHMGQVKPSENDLLGYALDGFPIYGPISDVSGLDGCNGRTVDGQYIYHVRVSTSSSSRALLLKQSSLISSIDLLFFQNYNMNDLGY